MPRKSSGPTTKSQQQKRIADANVKKLASLLKSKGLIYQNRDLRSQKVTPYMRKKVRELAPVLTREAEVVRVPRGNEKLYREDSDVISTGRGFIAVKSEPNIVKGYRRGMRSAVRPLKDGNTIEMLQLPFKSRDILDVLQYVKSGEADRLKQPKDYFAFRFNSFASLRTFPNSDALADYLMRYVRDRDEDEDDTIDTVVLYRVYPPGAWEEIVKREQAERAPAKAERERQYRAYRARVRRARMAQFYAKPDPLKAAQEKEAKAAAYREREKERKRLARAKATDEQRAKDAARKREKRKG